MVFLFVINNELGMFPPGQCYVTILPFWRSLGILFRFSWGKLMVDVFGEGMGVWRQWLDSTPH